MKYCLGIVRSHLWNFWGLVRRISALGRGGTAGYGSRLVTVRDLIGNFWGLVQGVFKVPFEEFLCLTL